MIVLGLKLICSVEWCLTASHWWILDLSCFKCVLLLMLLLLLKELVSSLFLVSFQSSCLLIHVVCVLWGLISMNDVNWSLSVVYAVQAQSASEVYSSSCWAHCCCMSLRESCKCCVYEWLICLSDLLALWSVYLCLLLRMLPFMYWFWFLHLCKSILCFLLCRSAQGESRWGECCIW